jgi:hypothetical protein
MRLKGVFNMENNFVMVKSASDWQLVMNIPHLSLSRTWTKRGQQYPIDRSALVQAFYDPSVETLFREGALVCSDVEFLREVGLLDEDTQKSVVYELTDTMKTRLIKLMPLAEVKAELAKMTHTQIEELAEYAVFHYNELVMDRIDLLSKASGKNIMEAIKNYKAAQED